MFNCKGALSQILHHHHHVFILAGGGRVDYEAKWGEKQTHTHTGLVATSFMRRSCAAKQSVICIYLHEMYVYAILFVYGRETEIAVEQPVPNWFGLALLRCIWG